MSTIKVTPEQLHHVSSQVDQARQQLEHIQDNLSRQMMFLQAMWMGVTQERFYDDFERSRPVLQKALESMVYTSKELKDIAIRFENADAEKGSLGGAIGAVGAAAMMKSSASDVGSGDKGYRMKKVDVYGRYVWVPVNENGELDYTAVQAYAKDQGNVNIDRMQGVHTEAPEEDIFKMQVKSLENRIHPFTGEPVSDKYAQIMLTSLKFSQILMAFQMVRGSMPGRKGPFRLPASDPAVAKIKKNMEAGEVRKTSSTERTSNVRMFISTDKYVGETANAIEARYPGKVVDVNKKVYRDDGTPLTDYDIELDNAIIQVKQGGGKGATRQAINTASSTNKEVIVYLPNQISNSAVVKGLQKEGFQVFTSETDLINYVGR
ncbi:WXG100 family type VII secretion target [Paenibacillus barcinonensis]|uniref:WXG100 family type VII secretion target n=1 Tax=Paenibacillus barcinonensis TaxID=198119 RepID=UPI001C108266|nr:WXG100 family type VII secretion target [Paenibacillus barcinonensis]MBU5352579.1 WXG100 family type VII secretion target [Paenibacillus barcinonensis]